jgi:hypothetical protein
MTQNSAVPQHQHGLQNVQHYPRTITQLQTQLKAAEQTASAETADKGN